MEHTDAGTAVGLADTCLPEYAFAGNGDMPPAATRPVPPEAPIRLEVPISPEVPIPPEVAVAPPHGAEESNTPGGVTTPAGTRGVTESDIDVVDVDDDVIDNDITYNDLIEHGGVAPALPASQALLREPGAHVADVVDLRFASLFPEPMEWQERALCAQTDPEAFFPEKGGSTREAKRICSGCEVRPQCLEYALANDERFGIWGGMSERERRKQRRRAV